MLMGHPAAVAVEDDLLVQAYFFIDQEAADAVAAAYEEGIGLEDLIRKSLKVAAGKKFS